MIATHNIQEITFEQNFMNLYIDGKKIKVSLDEVSAKLKSATELQRNFYKVSPSGYGIHWPLIDKGLIGRCHSENFQAIVKKLNKYQHYQKQKSGLITFI